MRSRLAAICFVVLAHPLPAQYPLTPSPLFDPAHATGEIGLSGYLSVRQTRRNDSTTFIVNRARLAAVVAPRPFVALKLQADFSAAGRLASDSAVPAFALTDAFVEFAAPDSASLAARHHAMLAAGQFRTPFSMEYLTPFSRLQTASRSLAVDQLTTRRDIGVMAQAALLPSAVLTAALVNGEGANETRNPDGREMAIARLTVAPWERIALGGKWGGQGDDHLWGYDARWVAAHWIVEGEALRRQRAPGAAVSRAGGGYVLASWRALPWLQPKVKWEQYAERGGAPRTGTTWVTAGANLLSHQEAVRLQLEWVHKVEHPTEVRNDEILAQLLTIF